MATVVSLVTVDPGLPPPEADFTNQTLNWRGVSQKRLLKSDRLWAAVANGQLKLVEDLAKLVPHEFSDRLLTRGLVERGPEGETILHVAILFYRGEGVDSPDTNSFIGLSPNFLLWARMSNCRAQGTEFRGIDKGTLRRYGQTPLHFAVVSGKPNIAKRLVEHDPECVNDVDDISGYNVLHLLAANKDLDTRSFFDLFSYLKAKDLGVIQSTKAALEPTKAQSNLAKATPLQYGILSENLNALESLKEIFSIKFDKTTRYRVLLNELDPLLVDSTNTHKSIIQMAVDSENKEFGKDISTTRSDFGLHVENILFGMAAMVGWGYLLNFAKGSERVGPMVYIVWEIVTTDFVDWLWIYVPLVMGFAVVNCWVVRFALGQGVYSDMNDAQIPLFGCGLFLVYGFLVTVLMLNVLIGKVSDTFQRINNDAKREWKVQLACLITTIDLQLSKSAKARYVKKFGFSVEKNSNEKLFEFIERNDSGQQARPFQERLIQVVVREEVTGQTKTQIALKANDLKHWHGWKAEWKAIVNKMFG
ncbi:UNVERIFIED_CONTAM: hypothetical protein HDU68_012636, partial [Siphonaria sp. JEL0065]